MFLWAVYLYNTDFDVSSVLRDLLCILKKTLDFFFHLLFNQLQNFYIYAQHESLGEGHPMHNVCGSSSISPPVICKKEKAFHGPHRFLVCLSSLNKRRKDLRQVPMFQSSRKRFWAIIRENSKEGGKREITGLVKACKTTPVIKTSYAVLGLQKLSLTKELIHTHTKGKKLAIKKYFSIMQLLQLYN